MQNSSFLFGLKKRFLPLLVLCLSFLPICPAFGAANVVESSTLTLSQDVATSGNSVTGTVTLKNIGNQSITLSAIAIASRTPSNGNADFGGKFTQTVLAPNGSVTVTATRLFSGTDPLGTWTAFCSYQTTDSLWHQLAPTLKLTVYGAKTFEDVFNATSLNRTVWNPFITNNAAAGWPWNMQDAQGIPSCAIGGQNSVYLDYDLPAQIFTKITTSGGVGLKNQTGSSATGYSWTGAVISSYPNTHYGTTTGFTFADKYIEVSAQMPWTANGCWPAIWFLAAPGSSGPEIDLHEGGFKFGGSDPDRVFSTTLFRPDGSTDQTQVDVGLNLSAAAHTYGMAYKQGQYIRIYFDRKLIREFNQNVPSGSYFIILNNGVASGSTSTWHSQINSQTPSANWMSIQYVRAFNL